jgi:hypothetical protein
LNSTSNTEDQTRWLAPGTHVFSAAYSGDASFNASQSNSFTVTIVKAQTSNVLQLNAGSVSAGATLTLSAQINALGFSTSGLQGFGSSAPSGTITFMSGGVTLGIATLTQNPFPTVPSDYGLVNFTFPASELAIGNNTITASYSGDANYQPSASSASVSVTASTLTKSVVVLSLSSASVAMGGSFIFTAVVSPDNPEPTGAVTFFSDGQAVSKPFPLLSGTASVSSELLTIAPGTHLITALYSGDANYQASLSAPATFTIGSATIPSTTTITVSPTTAALGTDITVAATITAALPVPGGTTQLMLDGNLYGLPASLTDATASLPLSTATLQSGAHVIRVSYSGDASHLASTSAATTLSLLAPVGTFTLSPSAASTTVPQGKSSSDITLTVTPSGGFHSTIAFACTGGLPSAAVCSFTPASIMPVDSNSETTVLTISSASNTSRTTQLPVPRGFSKGIGVAMAGMILFFLPRRIRRWSAFALVLTLLTLGGISGCGRGGVDPNASSFLTAGTYAVTVRAAGGSTIQTATINLTVQ